MISVSIIVMDRTQEKKLYMVSDLPRADSRAQFTVCSALLPFWWKCWGDKQHGPLRASWFKEKKHRWLQQDIDFQWASELLLTNCYTSPAQIQMSSLSFKMTQQGCSGKNRNISNVWTMKVDCFPSFDDCKAPQWHLWAASIQSQCNLIWHLNTALKHDAVMQLARC